MNLVPCIYKDVFDTKRVKRSKNLELLEEFLSSGMKCAMIEDHHYCSADSGQNSLRQSIVRFGLSEIEVRVHNGNLYLVNTSIKDD